MVYSQSTETLQVFQGYARLALLLGDRKRTKFLTAASIARYPVHRAFQLPSENPFITLSYHLMCILLILPVTSTHGTVGPSVEIGWGKISFLMNHTTSHVFANLLSFQDCIVLGQFSGLWDKAGSKWSFCCTGTTVSVWSWPSANKLSNLLIAI